MARNISIKLASSEWMVAGLTGTMRRVASLQNGNNKNKHAEKSDWQTDTDGAAAEIAVAKYLNVYWVPGVNEFKRPDVAGFQVRSTTLNDGRLIIRENDSALERYILVITEAPNCLLVGSILGGKAKVPEFWWKDAWWVSQDRLEDLPEVG